MAKSNLQSSTASVDDIAKPVLLFYNRATSTQCRVVLGKLIVTRSIAPRSRWRGCAFRIVLGATQMSYNKLRASKKIKCRHYVELENVHLRIY